MFSVAYRYYVLILLTSVYMLSLVDRGLMNILLQAIKQDLALSDTQLGLVSGIAFGLFYATLGVPIARMADRGNRANLVALAIGTWGVTVMATFLVVNFVQLALARVAAAVGEAGCKPVSYSLVGDYFPDQKGRVRALSIYTAGNFLSMPLAYIIGGWLNELYGWRLTFLIMAIPGIALAILAKLTLVEPRSKVATPASQKKSHPPMKEVVTTLWKMPSTRNLALALILFYVMGAGMGPWKAVFMIRNYDMGTAELGIWLGIVYGLAGVGGALFGGYIANRWFGDNVRGQMRMSAVAAILVIPFYGVFLMASEKSLAVAGLIPQIFVFSIFLGPTYALLQRLVPDEMRATSLSILMLFANLIGMGVGPLMVGVLSDFLRPALGEIDGLRYAMLTASLVALGVAYFYLRVAKSVESDLTKVLAPTGAAVAT